MRKTLFLFLMSVSYFLHAEFQIFAYKDKVWTWSEEEYKNGHFVQVGEKLPTNSKLDLRTVDSYVALLNTTTHKIIEVKENVYHTYEQLQELETKAKKLPPLDLELVKHDRAVYRGCRCIGSSVVKIYPIDVNDYYAQSSEPLVIHYETTPVDDREYGKLKLKVYDMMGYVLYEEKLKPEALSKRIELPIHKFDKAEIAGVFFIKLEWGQETVEKIIYTEKSEKYSENYQQKRDLFVKNFDLKNMTIAEKIYVMIWTYQEDMPVEGYTIFREFGDLSEYKGFDAYYQELHKYYVHE